MQNQKQPYRYYSSYSSVRPVAVAAVAVPNRRLQILPVVIAALIIFGVSLALRTLHHPARAEVKAAATQAVSSLPSIPPVDEAALAAQINRIIASHPTLDMAVSINDVTNGKQYNYGLSDAGFIAASTGKIVTASLFLHQVEQGQESLTASLNGKSSQEELRLMIEESDNDAWAALNHELTHGSLLSYARSLGLKSYDPETNLISPADLSSFLGQLYQQKLLNKNHTELLLSFMQQANETQYIAAAIPAGIKLYHKAGYLSDRAHDAAIIDNGKHPYTLIIFTKARTGAVYDQTAGAAIMHQITGVTLKAFGAQQ